MHIFALKTDRNEIIEYTISQYADEKCLEPSSEESASYSRINDCKCGKLCAVVIITITCTSFSLT